MKQSAEYVRIAGVQCTPVLGAKQQNLDLICRKIGEAADAGAGLVVFPECMLTGYCYESLDEASAYAETIPGPACDVIVEACRAHDALAAFGLLERRDNGIYNAAALTGPDGVIGSYRKVHIPYIGADKFSTPGDRPFQVFDTPCGRIGLNICYDFAFPEAARALALQGADIILLLTNWPPGAEEASEHLPNARALENHVYYAAIDRVGEERGFQFIGRSRIADYNGRTLAEAGDEETILYADLSPVKARNKHLVRVPGKHEIHRFNDRRPDFYGDLVSPVKYTATPAS